MSTGATIGTGQAQVGILAKPGTTGITGAQAWEGTHLKKAYLSLNGESVKTLRMYISTDKIYGSIPGQSLLDTTWGAVVTTNPASRWSFDVLVQAVDEASAATVTCFIEVVYYTKFDTRASVTQS